MSHDIKKPCENYKCTPVLKNRRIQRKECNFYGGVHTGTPFPSYFYPFPLMHCYKICNLCRNLQKKKKKSRYEQEKGVMGTLRGVGCVTGEYAGDGKGEADDPESSATASALDADPVVELLHSEEDEDDGSSSAMSESHPLLILYDCETTGLSIYTDHITDLGAKVIQPPLPVPNPTFSSLVRTGRNISTTGILKKRRQIITSCNYRLIKIVSRVTGITSNLLRGERPLSVVLPLFIEWITSNISFVREKTGIPRYPGIPKLT